MKVLKKFWKIWKRTWSKSLVFRNYFFLWISTLESPNQKTELDGMFIFWCWFFDFFSFWPIKSADLQNPGFQSKIWTRWQFQKYLSKLEVWFCEIFTRLLYQNAWTSSLCAHLNNDVFWISTAVMWTRNAQVSFHNINSWISSILEIPACIFSLRNLCNV